MGQRTTGVWHHGKHHWSSRRETQSHKEVKLFHVERTEAKGTGMNECWHPTWRKENKRKYKLVMLHANSLRTKIYNFCLVIQQPHCWIISKTKKVTVLEKSLGLHTRAQRILTPTEPLPQVPQSISWMAQVAARKSGSSNDQQQGSRAVRNNDTLKKTLRNEYIISWATNPRVYC